MLLLLLSPPELTRGLEMWGNMTSIACDGAAVSQEERANCTITTRDELGNPAPGAEASDFKLYPSEGLDHPSSLYGGPIHWHVDFATCPGGEHNVTVQHGGYNTTTQALVVGGQMSNLTLDCERGREDVVAGETVTCAITTLDACSNPTARPPLGECRG
jgi:hypothetical protein